MSRSSLQFQQLSRALARLTPLQEIALPPSGWIRALRTTLGMTLEQLGQKMNRSKQAIRAMEEREAQGAITLHSLREAAQALDMHLVYGFVPRDGTLDALVERKALELATQIVLRTAQTMQLEDQSNTPQRIESAIRERTAALKDQMPKLLWD